MCSLENQLNAQLKSSNFLEIGKNVGFGNLKVVAKTGSEYFIFFKLFWPSAKWLFDTNLNVLI